MRKGFLILNGPNLNWTGKRNPSLYGTVSYEELCRAWQDWGKRHEVEVHCFQSNSEGVLIDKLQSAEELYEGVVFNPGALAHTSIALGDCVESLTCPVVEVHITPLLRRDSFRRGSYLADKAQATITGFGTRGYTLGLELLYAEAKGGRQDL